MRLRKNTKLFKLSPTSNVLRLRCHINQSPWDIATFTSSSSSSDDDDSSPPSSPNFHFKKNEDFGLAGNDSSEESIDSIHSAESTNAFMEDEEVNKDSELVYCKDDGEERAAQVGFNKAEKEKEVYNEDWEMCLVLGRKKFKPASSEPACLGRSLTMKSSLANDKAESSSGLERRKKEYMRMNDYHGAAMDDDAGSIPRFEF